MDEPVRTARMRILANSVLPLLLLPIALSVACGDDTSDGGSNPGGNDAAGGNEGGAGGSPDGGSNFGGAPEGGAGARGDGGTGGAEVGVAPTITGPTSPLADLSAGTSPDDLAFTATGDSPITWTVSAGALPDGMTLDETTGVYSGTPSLAGEFSFTITATNDVGTDDEVYLRVSETSGGSTS